MPLEIRQEGGNPSKPESLRGGSFEASKRVFLFSHFPIFLLFLFGVSRWGHIYIYIYIYSPNSVYTMGFWLLLEAVEGIPAQRGSGRDLNLQTVLANIVIGSKSELLAAVWSSVEPRRCSHSNICFGNPYKTSEQIVSLCKKPWFYNVFVSATPLKPRKC